jgi:hypothetical protein
MKLQQKIFGIGLLTAVIVPHLYEKGYTYSWALYLSSHICFLQLLLFAHLMPKNITVYSTADMLDNTLTFQDYPSYLLDNILVLRN